MSRIYTRTGDGGETGLGDGSRVAKTSLRVESYGTVDEANAVLGMARLSARGATDAMLARIQNDLFDLGADLAEARGKLDKVPRIGATQVARLEREIDALERGLKPLKNFVLPGGTKLAAALHLGRTIVRRAERRLAALAAHEPVNPEALKYLNRLSDHLFVLARHANRKGRVDVLWRPGANR
ncbi:MAG TPA: cob(I)yrinic acid a,c-diamide adenosyltransferase [Stellaceae bacterium]|nr:cob(I)yrinic acid a,c-diamide adenosyltransferase [Stellaceae bacterium]